ncbi:Ephrin_rec_like domain-containing protein [Durusdinium trenchii]|uniref:Ephrin_rec_like domain-containing protein n=1 Tax=Durusdinium trenchii TaxID=1381693 RepID=A0ABP0IJX9_9DINO
MAFPKDYNTSWERPSQYFTTIDQINRSKLMLCEETLLMSVKMMSTYLEITGDHEGVSQGTGGITGRCFDQYFWYAPACRRNSSSCIPCFTGGTGWGSLEMLQKATFLGIPLAWITAKDWNAYSALPKDYDSIFYWWTPDPTFLRRFVVYVKHIYFQCDYDVLHSGPGCFYLGSFLTLLMSVCGSPCEHGNPASLNAEQIMFPAHNGVEWAKGDHRSAAFAIQIDKYISQDGST